MNNVSPENVVPLLKTHSIGRGTYSYAEEYDSTNTVCRSLVRQGAPSGSLAVCELQTAGKGRLNREWQVNRGEDLTQSVLLKVPDPSFAPLYTFCAAIAVQKAIREVTPSLSSKIKWPNDVLIGGKKVCGILCELVNQYVVIGVGINVNRLSFPPALQATATSLKIETKTEIDRCPLFASYLYHLEKAVETLEEQGASALIELYRPLCATLGAQVRVMDPVGEWLGFAKDVTDNGALIVVDEQGR